MKKATNQETLRYCIDISGNFYITLRNVKDPYTAVFTDLLEAIAFLYAMNTKISGNFEELVKFLQKMAQEEASSTFVQDVASQKEVTILDNSCYELHRRQKAARARRREMELRKCARLIELASDDVYLESGKLARHSGIVYRKVLKAEKELSKSKKPAQYIRATKRGTDIFRQAKVYRNHLAYSANQGAYFESKYIKAAPLHEAECKNESASVKPDGIKAKEVATINHNKHLNTIRYCNKPMKAAIFHEGGKKYVYSKSAKISTQFRFIPLVDVSRLHGTRTVSRVISRHF